MLQEHPAHLLRADLNLWCGGTQPPTEVRFNDRDKELMVEVYPESHDTHAGTVGRVIQYESFFLPFGSEVTPDLIGKYALRALND